MRKLRLYWLDYTQSVRETAANRFLVVGGVLLTMVRVFLYSEIYRVVSSSANIGLSFENVVWSLAIFLVFNFNLGLRDLFGLISTEVAGGDIEAGLLQPYDWRIAKVCRVLGKNTIELCVAAVVLPPFLLWRIGAPDVSFWDVEFVLGYLLLSILAVVCSCALFMTIGLITFWLTDTWVLSMLAQRVITVLGGGFVPVALLSAALQVAAQYSPFGVYGAPTRLFSSSLKTTLWSYVLASALWGIVTLWVNQRVWRAALKRIAINGVENA